ncbi:NAD(P)H-binding protein [Staphylococcus felis]|uniref:NAD(P)-dependent oxidoreductase n=1 Tax=Staphylococcus felis TaxID=46127 RepID=UPI0032D9ADA1
MKVGIIGATGQIGNLILKEALNDGLEVTAIVRDASKLVQKDVSVIEKDTFDLTKEDLQPFDVVVSAFGAPLGETEPHVKAGRVLINALDGTDTRLVIVGGAGSLYTDDSKTQTSLEAGQVPDFVVPTATGHDQNLQQIKKTESLNWTFVSPSSFFDFEGPRTTHYRIGGNVLLTNADGESYVSYADYALAMIEIIKNNDFIKQHITVVSDKA